MAVGDDDWYVGASDLFASYEGAAADFGDIGVALSSDDDDVDEYADDAIAGDATAADASDGDEASVATETTISASVGHCDKESDVETQPLAPTHTQSFVELFRVQAAASNARANARQRLPMPEPKAAASNAKSRAKAKAKPTVLKKPAAPIVWLEPSDEADNSDNEPLSSIVAPSVPLATPSRAMLVVPELAVPELAMLAVPDLAQLAEPEPNQEAVQSLGVDFAPLEIRCSKCDKECDPLRSIGKSGGKWKCNFCNTKLTQLNRLFGGWPIPEMVQMTKAQEVDFFNAAHQCENLSLLEDLVIETMTEVIRHKDSVSLDGEWLPLSVWEKTGYDPGLILASATSSNSKPNARFGMLYKVVVERDSKTKERELVRAKLCEKRSSRRGKDVMPIAPNPADVKVENNSEVVEGKSNKKNKQKEKRKKRKRKHSSSSSSTSSSTSSESSEHVKCKKKRQGKESRDVDKAKAKAKANAEKTKELETMAKESAKQDAKDRKKGNSDANKVVAKLSGLEITLANQVRPLPIHKHVPAFAINGVKEALVDVQAKLKEAKAQLKGTAHGLLSVDLSDVDALDKKAKQNSVLLSTMMESVAKHV